MQRAAPGYQDQQATQRTRCHRAAAQESCRGDRCRAARKGGGPVRVKPLLRAPVPAYWREMSSPWSAHTHLNLASTCSTHVSVAQGRWQYRCHCWRCLRMQGARTPCGRATPGNCHHMTRKGVYRDQGTNTMPTCGLIRRAPPGRPP